MAVKYGKIEIPKEIVLEEREASNVFARFIAEPLEKGYGYTIGNALRRMLLSSLESPAIISVRIEGIPHEYMAVEGILEDMTNVILNIKGALLRRLPTDESVASRDMRMISSTVEVTQEDLDKNGGAYQVKLGDLIENTIFEVINPELVIFTVTKPQKRQVDFKVAYGKGYVPSERHVIRGKTADEIVVDSAFSPVRLVSYFVENTRVGQDTDYDRLVLEITTDGRITPSEALSFATQISLRYFEVFKKVKSIPLTFDEGDGGLDTDFDDILEKLALRIDEIELSVRSTNCLSGANIETIAELVSIPERRMLEFRNFGKKSLNEIKAKLTDMGLFLGMDLSRYGLDLDNLKDEIKKIQEKKKKKIEEVNEEEV